MIRTQFNNEQDREAFEQGLNQPVDVSNESTQPQYWDMLKDTLAAPFRGVEQGLQEAYSLADYLTLDVLPDWETDFLGESTTLPGKLVEGAAQFATGFIPIAGQLGKVGWLAKAGKTGKAAKALAAGAAADFTMFDAQEERLSNLIQSVPALENPLTAYLAADGEDGELEGRLKNVIEGAGLGLAADTLLAGFRAIKGSRQARAGGASPEATAEAAFSKAGNLQDKLQPQLRQNVADPEYLSKLYKEGRVEIRENVKAHADEHAELNTSLIVGSDELHLALKTNVEVLKAKGFARKTRTRDETLEAAARVKANMTGLPEDAVLSQLRGGTEKLEEGSLLAVAAIDYVEPFYNQASELINKAVKSGSDADALAAKGAIDRFTDLHKIIAGQGTVTGRALKSRAYIRDAELQSLDRVQTLIGEAGGSDFLSKELRRLSEVGDPYKLAKLTKVQETQGHKLFRAHNEYWINSILSGPRTAAVNLLSSSLNTFYRPLEGAVGSLFEGDVQSAQTFARHAAYIFSSIGDAFRMGVRSFMKDDNILDQTSRVSDVIPHGPDHRKLSSQYLGVDDQSVQGKLLDVFGTIVNTPSRFLMASDEVIKNINYRAHAKTRFYEAGQKQGLKGLELAGFVNQRMDEVVTASGRQFSEASILREAAEKADEEGILGTQRAKFMLDYTDQHYNAKASKFEELLGVAEKAQDLSRDVTFTTPLTGGFGRKLQEISIKFPAFQLVMPFVRTPVNLLNFAGQRALPTKHLKFLGIHKRFTSELTSTDPLIRAQARGRQVMGAGILFSASALVTNNIITGGGPSDPEERKLLEQTGWQPYSIKLGDTYVSYQRFDPFAMLFGTVADMHDVYNRSEEHMSAPSSAMTEAVFTALSENIFNKSYLTGVQRVLQVLEDPSRGGYLINSQAASYVPNILNQASNSITGEDYMREANGLLETIKKRLPGAAQTLEPVRNILGEKVDARRYALGSAARAVDWVSPVMMSREKQDPVFTELARLNHAFSKPSNLRKSGVDMLDFRDANNRSAYDYWLARRGETKLNGRTLRQQLHKLIKSKYYNKLADSYGEEVRGSPRISAINRQISLYNKAALRDTYKAYPEFGDVERRYSIEKTILNRGGSIEEAKALSALY